MCKKNLILTIVFLLSGLSFGQIISEKGLPFVQNYLPNDYDNHGKIWESNFANNGLVYLALDNGLLEFDGQTWNRFRDYRGNTRSLCVINDSTIYIGADMDFGVWKKNNQGKFKYTSFYPFKKKTAGINEEFWGTYQLNGKIVFVSHQNIYVLNKGKISKIAAPTWFSESFQIQNKVYLSDKKNGLYEYDGAHLKLLFQYPTSSGFEISGVYQNQNTPYVVTKDQGVFSYADGKLGISDTHFSPEIFNSKVFSFATIGNKYLAFGTILNGLYITDLHGRTVQHFNKNKGLANNTVLSINYQNNGKLWLGLDFGISCININNNISYFYNTNNDFGTGYTATLKDNLFYLGTNQGLYIANWDQLDNSENQNVFGIIDGSEGQVWTLENFDGQILCGHDKGLFEVNGKSLTKIYDEPGIQCLYRYNENYIFAGTYNGISIFQKSGNSWKFLKKMPLILGAVNQILKEGNNTFWVNIPNYGFIKFNLGQNFTPLNRQIINSKNLNGTFPHLFIDDKKVRVVTSVAQYSFDQTNKRFVKDNIYPKNLHAKDALKGVYNAVMFTRNYGFYPINNGFALERFNSENPNTEFNSNILFRNTKYYSNEGTYNFVNNEKIPYRFNNIQASFLLPNEEGIEYEYFLENFSKFWSNWSSKNTVNFVDLKEGKYILKVKARKGNQVIKIQELKFEIKSPWYRTFWAYLLYFLLFIGGIYFQKKYEKNKLKKQKLDLLRKEQNSLREQAEKHRQEILIEKQKQLEMEKNMLKDEIRNKTIELATKAKDDEDKNRILLNLSEKIVEIENNPNTSKAKLGEIRRMLKTYLDTEDHTFEIQMDELHQEFFKAMKKRFPNLSIYDLRLCAYLKIGLNSKEMSDILQVLPSSINVSRSRLRKKLGLQPQDDLYQFLNQL